MGLPIVPEEREEYVAPSSMSEVADAAFELSRLDNTETMAIAKHVAYNDLNSRGKQLTVEQLNEKFPGVRFDEPMSDLAGQFKYDQIQEKQKLQRIVQNGNTGFFRGKVVPFAAGMGAVLTDPIGFTINYATAGLGRMATAARLAKTGGTVTKTAQFGINLAENIAGNAISEAIVFSGTKAEQEEYTAEQFFNNVVTSSLIFTTATSGLGALVDRIGGRNVDDTFSMTETNLAAGKDPGSLISDTLDFAQKDIEIDPTFSSTFKSSFPELDLAEGANLRNAYEQMYEAVGEGRIAESQVDDFIARLEDSNYPKSKLAYAEDNFKTEFNEEFVTGQNQKMDAPQADYGWDKDAEQAFKEAPDKIDQSRYDSEIEQAVAEVDLSDAPELKKVFDEFEETSNNYVEAVQQFANCELGL